MDLFPAISTNGLLPNVVTYTVVMVNLVKEGLLEESDNLILAMEKSGCAPDSRMINVVVRILLVRGEMIRAGSHLSKIDENFSLEASTVLLLLSLLHSSLNIYLSLVQK
jgi:pentatricopeptide repeat protein